MNESFNPQFEKEFNNKSYEIHSDKITFSNLQFVASPIKYVGYLILIGIGSALSFGILYPFLMGYFVQCCVQNTKFNGKNLRFVGSSIELYIKIIFFGIIGIFTFGLGFLFYGYYFTKWIIENIVVD